MINVMPNTEDIPPMPLDPRLLVAAKALLVRAGLASLLGDQTRITVVGQSDGQRLEGEIDLYRPDVLLWDTGTAGDLIDYADGVPTVALVSDEAVARDALGQGFKGVLPRDASPRQIVTALIGATQGMVMMDASLITAPSLFLKRHSESPNMEGITPRELEVLKQLAQGTSNKAIAYELDISEHTVKFHVTSIMAKLDARSRTEAVVTSTRMGLIPL